MLIKKSLIAICFMFSAVALFANNAALEKLIEQKSATGTGSAGITTSSGPSASLAMSSANYKVTAGDVYSLTFLAGNTPVAYTITVDSNYKVRVANLAILDAKNTTFIDLKKQVEAIVTRNYPMSGVQFNLITPGVFSVVVKGEVNSTVNTTAWAMTRLSSIVNNVKNEYSSIRNVQITSSNGTTKTYDLFKAERFGDLSQDPFLRPDDIITISPIEKQVTISGAVKRPGTYELLEGEGLKELINYYGNGFTPLADPDSIELSRISNYKTGEAQNLSQKDIDNNFELLPYDYVSVLSFDDLKPSVTLKGAVTKGETTTNAPYIINQGSSSSNIEPSESILIKFNKGENYGTFARKHRQYFNSDADLEKAFVIRNNEIIPINLYDVLYNNSSSDLLVEANDILNIPSIQLLVNVIGAVKVPGHYPYIPGKDWSYYINMAGGFIDERNSFESVKIVDANGNKLKKDDPISPETTITAKSNDFLYYFNNYMPVITTTVAAISSIIALIGVFANK